MNILNEAIKMVQKTRTDKRIIVCDDLDCGICKDRLEISAREFKEKIIKKLQKFSDDNQLKGDNNNE
jgi:hypothetical protein